MPVVIDELQVEIVPGQSTGSEPAAPQPAEGGAAEDILALLELARERAERLACD